jgi:hypothetical protein
MRRLSRLTAAAVSSLALFALLSAARTAHADEAPLGAAPAVTVTNRAAVDAPPPDAVTDDAPRADFKPLTLSLNPLSLVLGRIGANVEYLPVAHHAIVANPFFQSISVSSTDEKTQYSNFGAEIGYHYYTGKRGASGFFVGPSLLVMTARSSVTPSGTGASRVTDSFFSYGAALDVGGQHVFDSGFTIGGGAGLMYLVASNENSQTSGTVKFSGVLPRFLFTVGWSL